MMMNDVVLIVTETATEGVLWKKVFLKISQNSQENAWVSFLIMLWAWQETLAQVFSCEFCEIFKNTVFREHFRVTVSDCDNFLNYDTLRTKQFWSRCRPLKVHKFLGVRF